MAKAEFQSYKNLSKEAPFWEGVNTVTVSENVVETGSVWSLQDPDSTTGLRHIEKHLTFGQMGLYTPHDPVLTM